MTFNDESMKQKHESYQLNHVIYDSIDKNLWCNATFLRCFFPKQKIVFSDKDQAAC